MEQLRKYTQRRRAKEAALGLLKLNTSGDISVKAYIVDWNEYYLRVSYPDHLDDEQVGRIEGVLMHSTQASIHPSSVSAEDCIEFYQGEGMSRFRGV